MCPPPVLAVVTRDGIISEPKVEAAPEIGIGLMVHVTDSILTKNIGMYYI
jgi:hypothetical protein